MGNALTRTASAAGRRVLVLLAVAAIAGSVLSAVGSQQASAAGVPLRQVNWRAVLQNDPAITIDPDAYQLSDQDWPYIHVNASRMTDDTIGGYALIEDVLYGDLDGDGAEEAIVPFHSGGTAGMLGFLLYREATPAPRLVLVRSGYKLGVAIEGNKVLIFEPEYVGFEPNCCPSAVLRTVNALEGDRLVTLATEIEPNDVQEPTVWAFYVALSDRRFEDAYEFFSAEQKARNPFDQWRAGYANTQRIEVETSEGATPSEVRVELTATDTLPGGGTVTRRFTGTWTLIWSVEQRRWLLDEAAIRPA